MIEAWGSKQYILDLTWNGDHFSGNLDDAHVTCSSITQGAGKDYPLMIASHDYGGTFSLSQEVSVVVSGAWQKNPVSGSTAFNINLAQGSR